MVSTRPFHFQPKARTLTGIVLLLGLGSTSPEPGGVVGVDQRNNYTSFWRIRQYGVCGSFCFFLAKSPAIIVSPWIPRSENNLGSKILACPLGAQNKDKPFREALRMELAEAEDDHKGPRRIARDGSRRG